MNVTYLPGALKTPSIRRDAVLRARWDSTLVERFARAANAQGQTPAEVLRALALTYIAKAERAA